jgi:hypothetical protein
MVAETGAGVKEMAGKDGRSGTAVPLERHPILIRRQPV